MDLYIEHNDGIWTLKDADDPTNGTYRGLASFKREEDAYKMADTIMRAGGGKVIHGHNREIAIPTNGDADIRQAQSLIYYDLDTAVSHAERAKREGNTEAEQAYRTMARELAQSLLMVHGGDPYTAHAKLAQDYLSGTVAYADEGR